MRRSQIVNNISPDPNSGAGDRTYYKSIASVIVGGLSNKHFKLVHF